MDPELAANLYPSNNYSWFFVWDVFRCFFGFMEFLLARCLKNNVFIQNYL